MADTPLSDVAIASLASAARKPYPAQEINPGVTHKLVRMGLCVLEPRQSPFAKNGIRERIDFLVATDKGRKILNRKRPSWKATKSQIALLERIYTSGPTPLQPVNPKTYATLHDQGMVQTITVDGVVMIDLSVEGQYFMGEDVAG